MSKKEAAPFGAFALVTYVPDPLGCFIDQLRRSLPGDGFAQAHITILPPRPLQVPIETASEFAQAALSRFSPFTVALGEIGCFPGTNLLFLDLVRGQGEIQNLHKALNLDVLEHQERFEFWPHLTVGGPISEPELTESRQRVSEIWLTRNGAKAFQVLEVVGLWCDPALEDPRWTRVWTQRLSDQTC